VAIDYIGMEPTQIPERPRRCLMVKIDWNPLAAEAVLRLASADQRRVADAVGDFRWRVEHESGSFSAAEQHSMTAGSFEICFRVWDGAVEVRDVNLRDQAR